jgi:hypothetical protein
MKYPPCTISLAGDDDSVSSSILSVALQYLEPRSDFKILEQAADYRNKTIEKITYLHQEKTDKKTIIIWSDET